MLSYNAIMIFQEPQVRNLEGSSYYGDKDKRE